MDWIDNLITAASTAGVIVLGLLGWRVTHRTQKATERNQEHEQDDKAFARMKSLVDFFDEKWRESNTRIESLEKARAEDRRLAAEDRRELEETHRSVVALQGKVQRLEGRLIKAVNYIRDLLGLLVGQGIAHPPIPDEIAHLFDTKPGGSA